MIELIFFPEYGEIFMNLYTLKFIQLYTQKCQIYHMIILEIKKKTIPQSSCLNKYLSAFPLTVCDMRVSPFPMLWTAQENGKFLLFSNLRNQNGILTF